MTRFGRNRITATLVAVTTGLATAVLAVAAAPSASAATCDFAFGRASFDSTDFDQTVIGSPRADVGGAKDAGSVEIRYLCGGSTSTRTTLTLPTPHAGDLFGFATAALDIDADLNDDLVVGIPQYDVGGLVDAGAVAVFRGGADGPVFDRILVQGSDGVPGQPQAGARFGTTVSSFQPPYQEDFYTLRVGAPRKDVNGVVDAGAFVDLRYEEGGLVDGTQEVTLSSPGIPGAPHPGDLFGAALWRIDVVGAPGRDVDGQDGAGAVLVQGPSNSNRWVHQDTSCMPGKAEAGDAFGSAVSGKWIGVPGEDLGSAVDAGMVERDGGTRHLDCFGINAASRDFGGAIRSGDRFGAALSDLHTYAEDIVVDPYLLLVGAPGADVPGRANVGSVSYLQQNYDYEDGDTTLLSSGRRVGSAAGARFGAAIANGVPVISAPGASDGRGKVIAYKYGATAERVFSPPASLEDGVYGASLLGATA